MSKDLLWCTYGSIPGSSSLPYRPIESKFYYDTDPLLGGKSFSRICRDCARKIALRVDEHGEEHEPTKESVQKALYYLNKPFLETVWNASIQESENMVTGKGKENVWTSYIKNISMKNYVVWGYRFRYIQRKNSI